MTLELNGTTCLNITVGIIALLACTIIFLRKRFQKSEVADFQDFAMGKAIVFSYRPALLRIGFAASFAFVILAFSWTKYEAGSLLPDGWLLPGTEDLLLSPPPAYVPPPSPPQPPPAVEIVPDDISIEPLVFATTDIAADDPVEPKPVMARPVVTAPPLRPVVEESDEILPVSEVSPNFPGCEEIPGKRERLSCANAKLLKFIYENIRYPAAARDIGIEGMVVVRFVVEKDGSITQAEVLRDPGGGLGGEALRVVRLMPRWHPGRQHGRPVRVRFNLPVKFKLK